MPSDPLTNWYGLDEDWPTEEEMDLAEQMEQDALADELAEGIEENQ